MSTSTMFLSNTNGVTLLTTSTEVEEVVIEFTEVNGERTYTNPDDL
ncbi:hypothetical protein KHQ81_06830 [Mycoplasmatota bacterium]|nr:hypothetical protein KHQ81_06830 [Mycoplasmatota bacterium]